MEAKLTLKMEKRAIDSAKRYAKKHNRSLSRMVENYFKNLSTNYNFSKKHSSVVENLSGIFSEDELKKIAQEDERVKYIIAKEI